MVISYNPQGGFSEETLNFRARWEKSFLICLKRVRGRAEKEGKGVIWAGDFNVNPYRGDWSERAFDMISHKIKNGIVPAGCRPQDQLVYQEMVAAIGV